MKTRLPHLERPAAVLALLAVIVGITGCGGAARAKTSTGLGSTVSSAPRSPAEQAAADKGIMPYTKADVDFVSGMIGHHAQAVLMAGWAPSHGASPSVQALCERIVVAQRDEITFMRNWLRDRGQEVPDATSTKHKMKMDGMEHDMLMPGMLTDEEMAALDKARGPEFDRLFLIGMIKHHQGAITMVNDLFAANGSMQDDDVYKFASDVFADQSTEIERMQQMLNK
jgi:uncharacterized protein (DUF305 family)